jgi:hypothetical protein
MPSLFDITEYPKSQDFKKVQYFKSSVGNRTVRLLQPEKNYKAFAHYIKQTYVECLGKDECPICANNVKIKAQFGKEAKDHGVIWPIQRFAVNVLERTPTIICPKCANENYAGMNGRFSPACTACGTILAPAKPEPLNKVKLLSGGVELFSMINGYNESQLDEQGNPLGVANFDLNLMGIKQADGKIKVTPIPMPFQNDKVEVPEEELFDVKASLLHFTASEIGDLERGVKIKDIFAARRSAVTEPEEDDETVGDEADDIRSISEEAAKGILSA